MYSQKRNFSALFPISTFMCLWAIYIFPESVHIFSYSRIGRPILGIYKSLTDTWMCKLGLRPRYSFFWNICFKFSALCLCSVYLKSAGQPHMSPLVKVAVVVQFVPAVYWDQKQLNLPKANRNCASKFNGQVVLQVRTPLTSKGQKEFWYLGWPQRSIRLLPLISTTIFNQ